MRSVRRIATEETGNWATQQNETSPIATEDTVALDAANADQSQVRLLKLAKLRRDIESGGYRVPTSALANAMIEKANLGKAEELIFLTVE